MTEEKVAPSNPAPAPAADDVAGEVLSVNGGAMAGRMDLPLNTPKAR